MYPCPVFSLRKTRCRVLVGVFGTLLLIAATVVVERRPEDDPDRLIPPPETETASPVRVTVSKRGALFFRTEVSGMIRARSSADIISRVSGSIVQTYIHNGMFVRKGDTLVRIDDREYRLAYENARSELLGSQIEYRTLSASGFFGKVDSLQLRGSITAAHRRFQVLAAQHRRDELTHEAFDRARRDYETTIAYLTANREDVIAGKSGLSRAELEFMRAKLDLEGAMIRAPFSGHIANFRLSRSMHVLSGNFLFTLVSLSDPLLDVEVLESDIGRIAVGQNAQITVMAYPGKVFEGVVAEVNPFVDPDTKGVKVTIRFRKGTGVGATGLKPGMYANARIETRIFYNRLLVPRDAILIRDQRAMAFLAKGGYAEWRYISLGAENEEYFEVLSGISEGDSVIIEGHHTLAHDARIRVLED